jgi:hypothetical protein
MDLKTDHLMGSGPGGRLPAFKRISPRKEKFAVEVSRIRAVEDGLLMVN